MADTSTTLSSSATPSNGVPAAAGAAATGLLNPADAVVCPIPAPWAITLDVVMILSILIMRVALLSFLVRLVSRHTADISLRKSAGAALLMTALYAALCGSLDPKTVVLALSATVFIGFLLCKRLFWIGFECSLYACLAYALISAALSDLPTMQIDRLLPGRATVERSLAGLVDDHARRKMDDPSLPPSPTLRAAFTRVSLSTNESAFVALMLSPLRTEQKLRARIGDINKLATENARQVNALSGAGTNVGTRASEAAKLRANLGVARKNGKSGPAGVLVPGGLKQAIGSIGNVAGDEAAVVDALVGGAPAAGSPPADAGSPPPGEPAAPPPVPVTAAPAAAPTTAPVAAGELLGGLKASIGLGASSQVVAVAQTAPPAVVVPPPAVLAPVAVAQAAEPAPSPVVAEPAATTNADPLAALSAGERNAWSVARSRLVVTAVLRHSGSQGVVMVNNKLVAVGEIMPVESDGRIFSWRLLDASDYTAQWEPVPPAKPIPAARVREQ